MQFTHFKIHFIIQALNYDKNSCFHFPQKKTNTTKAMNVMINIKSRIFVTLSKEIQLIRSFSELLSYDPS